VVLNRNAQRTIGDLIAAGNKAEDASAAPDAARHTTRKAPEVTPSQLDRIEQRLMVIAHALGNGQQPPRTPEHAAAHETLRDIAGTLCHANDTDLRDAWRVESDAASYNAFLLQRIRTVVEMCHAITGGH
jgi:hypothetical protein